MGQRGGPKPFWFYRKIIKLELQSGFDLRGACKLNNKKKRLPWGRSVLNSASAVLQWVSSGFGTQHCDWKLPNTTWHLPAAKQPPEGREGIHKMEVSGEQVVKKGRNRLLRWLLSAGRGRIRFASSHPSGDLQLPAQVPATVLGLQWGWTPAKKTAFVFP